jgi:hypothetical protein
VQSKFINAERLAGFMRFGGGKTFNIAAVKPPKTNTRHTAQSPLLITSRPTHPLAPPYPPPHPPVRIEDNVLITPSGAESFTDVPRTVKEIEAVMAGGGWPLKA